MMHPNLIMPDKISLIERFEVRDLHSRQNISLNFEHHSVVFIADNGSGKTTALYMLQSILNRQYTNLLRFNFGSFLIRFRGERDFIITRDEIEARRGASSSSRMIARLNISRSEISELARYTRRYSYEQMRTRKSFMDAARSARLPSRVFYEEMQRFGLVTESREDLDEDILPMSLLNSFIKDKFQLKVIYLPTYRRVEQDLKSLIHAEAEGDEAEIGDIKFGMKDVSHRINYASRQIREKFFASYGQIAGQMLGQLSAPIPISPEMESFLNRRENIEIVISRAGSNVTPYQKHNILELFDESRLLDNQPLSFFLSSLVEASAEVEPIEKNLKSYGSVCNGYLINKEFRYDSFNARLTLFDLLTGDELALESLSSGEKQILGVMSQVYLGSEQPCVVVFDEPELSLSVEWQKKILVDVFSAERCRMLIAATHSPFIFDNELDAYAAPLEVSFFKPKKD